MKDRQKKEGKNGNGKGNVNQRGIKSILQVGITPDNKIHVRGDMGVLGDSMKFYALMGEVFRSMSNMVDQQRTQIIKPAVSEVIKKPN